MNANAGAGDAPETVETLDSVYLHVPLQPRLEAGDPAATSTRDEGERRASKTGVRDGAGQVAPDQGPP